MFHLVGISTFFETWKTFLYYYNFKVPKEFWKKGLITLFLIFCYRAGTHVPIPGIDLTILNQIFSLKYENSELLNQINLFLGGSLSRISIFSLHLVPYLITNLLYNIIFNNLSFFKKLKKKEGNSWKFSFLVQITVFFIALIQSIFLLFFLKKLNFEFFVDFGYVFLVSETIYTDFIIIMILILGTYTLQLIGHIIEKYGCGSGITIILFSGIISELFQNIWHVSNINKCSIFFIFIILLYIITIVEKSSIVVPIIMTQSTSIWNIKESLPAFFYILIPLNFFNLMPLITYHFLINLVDLFELSLLKKNTLWTTDIFFILLSCQIVKKIILNSTFKNEIHTTLKKWIFTTHGFQLGKELFNYYSYIINYLSLINFLYFLLLLLIPKVIFFLISKFYIINYELNGITVLLISKFFFAIVKRLKTDLLNKKIKEVFRKERFFS